MKERAVSYCLQWGRFFEPAPLGIVIMVILVTIAQRVDAEGTLETGSNQGLDNYTPLYVDIVDPATETIVWNGIGTVTVVSPLGNVVGQGIAPGETIYPNVDEPGVYWLYPLRNQFDYVDEYSTEVETFYDWDVTVSADGTPILGRLWSDFWAFNAGTFSEDGVTDASFFALVPGGEPEKQAVVELRLDGLAGYVYNIVANRAGPQMDGVYAGLSVPAPDGEGINVDFEFPIYLNPPLHKSLSTLEPTVSDFAWDARYINGDKECKAIVPGTNEANFTFETNVDGTYHIVCDLDDNGFDISSLGDLHLIGATEPGVNSVDWDGKENAGAYVPSGSYICEVTVTVGEFHYVGNDMETSYPGMRLFEVSETGTRTPLPMFWNDSLVQQNAVPMPNEDIGAETSGPLGLLSGDYEDEAVPHGETTSGNARAWGDFGATEQRDPEDPDHWIHLGKGNEALLDTYTFIRRSESETITFTAIDPNNDTDGDGLNDFVEGCDLGTDPNNPDTDGDNISDYDETDGGSLIDTDDDETIDALDDDSDDDDLLDIDEAGDTDLSTPPIDTDDDGTPDYRDPDEEDEPEDDGDRDGISRLNDNCPDTYNPDQKDSDSDGIGDACEQGETDTDDDGILDDGDGSGTVGDNNCQSGETEDCDDNCQFIPNPDQADENDDGIGDVCDDDPDKDGIRSDGDMSKVIGDNTCADGLTEDCDDNCPEVPNPDQADFDDDHLGDVCDDDADDDGTLSSDDCDDLDPEVAEEIELYRDQDDDGWGEPDQMIKSCQARDGYVEDQPDNCPKIANLDQADTDDDGIGDECDECPRAGGPLSNDGCPDEDAGAYGEVVDAGGDEADDSPKKSGCSCRMAGTPAPDAGLLQLLLFVGCFVILRRRF